MVTVAIGGDPLEPELEKFEITDRSLIVVRYDRALTPAEVEYVSSSMQSLMDKHGWKAGVLLTSELGLHVKVFDEEQMARIGWVRK